MTKILAIGLDGYEVSYADRLAADGVLREPPHARRTTARVHLDHGDAQRTGLGWEHFWSGHTPQRAMRDAAVEFDPATYAVWQEGARFDPFFASLGSRAVVFDTPYADFDRTPGVRGVVAWGAHDPGITAGPHARPAGLVDELRTRFGDYPATPWIYATPWSSADDTAAMGADLLAGLERRQAIAEWLLAERCPDWDLAVVVVSELHSATEGLWHGVDPAHPLHGHPSAAAAAAGLEALYAACGRLVDGLVAATEPTHVVVFSMGGMGTNNADVQAMLLLPELLYRWDTGASLLQVPEHWTADPGGVPGLDGESARWNRAWYPDLFPPPGTLRRIARRAGRVSGVSRLRRSGRAGRDGGSGPVGFMDVDWQPTTWYRPHWPTMRAFALPSFYDGRIRVNVRGRVARGVVAPADYVAVCDELEDILRACTDPRTGEPAVAAVVRPAGDEPGAVGTNRADLEVVWATPANALAHPVLGLLGPVPFRRTGGHTGPRGFATFSGPGITPGDLGEASSFDVAPTLLALLGCDTDEVSGTALLDRR